MLKRTSVFGPLVGALRGKRSIKFRAFGSHGLPLKRIAEHTAVFDCNYEATDRNETLVICIHELCEVVDLVKGETLKVMDRKLEAPQVNSLCLFCVVAHEVFLYANFHVFTFLFKRGQAFASLTLVMFVVEFCAHQLHELRTRELLVVKSIEKIIVN